MERSVGDLLKDFKKTSEIKHFSAPVSSNALTRLLKMFSSKVLPVKVVVVVDVWVEFCLSRPGQSIVEF